ncbi:rhomboid family intramembrane serine protease [Fulvivirga sediminis]|uniref:Rhomboid family intramembrane serine protease n=1 Tax=Fulvivirga sediminis TaxID=2803949 RepID=A0A937F647_9BACT|nr:rhomboid family intramembrane serine protease [Fulvivirga sediminis]MBL3655687.1 rhomboid family intramembrane serine protease [Fulvivirga sediminis]
MVQSGVKLRRSIYYTLAFVSIIWIVKIIEYTFHYNFGDFGILPRTVSGSIGIFTAPFIHGDVYHLLSNTFPLISLGIGIFYFYDKIAITVILLIYIMTGFWVWVAARDAYHIGASGVIYGMLTFLLLSGFLKRDAKSLAVSFIVLFIYGGSFFTGVIPGDQAVSWESHLMGAIAGIFCAIYFRKFGVVKRTKIEESAASIPTYVYHYTNAEIDEAEEILNKKKNNTIIYTIDSPFEELK